MAIKSAKPGAGFAWGWHSGVRSLRKAYESSRVTPDLEQIDIQMRAARHQKLVDAGEASWDEHDDEGNVVYSYGETLGEELYNVENVIALVRLAFVISLHHYVEQQLVDRIPSNQAGQKTYNEKTAFAWLKSFGWIPLEAELKALRLAANCAKHSQGRSAKELFTDCPDMFDTRKIEMGYSPGYDTLNLTDAHVLAFFEAVRLSVPDNLGISF